MDVALLEVYDAAKILGISTRRLHQLIAQGTISAIRTSRNYTLVRATDLEGLEITVEDLTALFHRKRERLDARRLAGA